MVQSMGEDAVNRIIMQWQEQGFKSDELVAMETIGRIKRLELLLMRGIAEGHKAQFDLAHWEFDVLATLRRAGEPYCLSPTALFDTMMVSSGTMTNRLQHLEKKKLISRVDNPDDKRSLLVQLTQAGKALMDKALPAHLERENELLAGMSQEELKMLNMLLKKVELQMAGDE